MVSVLVVLVQRSDGLARMNPLRREETSACAPIKCAVCFGLQGAVVIYSVQESCTHWCCWSLLLYWALVVCMSVKCM